MEVDKMGANAIILMVRIIVNLAGQKAVNGYK
jgi:hypothetical protein